MARYPARLASRAWLALMAPMICRGDSSFRAWRNRLPADAGRVMVSPGWSYGTRGATGAPRGLGSVGGLLQEILDAVALFEQFFQGEIHAFTREVVDFEHFDAGVFTVFSTDRHALDHPFGAAVETGGRHAHGDPLAVRAPFPVVYVIDG